ncbi:MAG: phosphoadenosine phosphosulfate reductase family protein, partial [Christensenellaceae bacterium]|nr:phosphoadenosine phosphosulfate reductase family protein [Christensenellaceae bacterium]
MQIEKWCKCCNKSFLDSEKCPDCGNILEQVVPTEIYWCNNCKVPIILELTASKHICPICRAKINFLAKDLRPVFPEERLLIELLIGKPFEWMHKSVWANNSHYYVDASVYTVSFSKYRNIDTQSIILQLEKLKEQNDSREFFMRVKTFIEANTERLKSITEEAKQFVCNVSSQYKNDQLIISFSGGKDSTVTSDIVIKALRDPCIRHIFGDTTLEIPSTYEYKDRYRKANPKAVFKIAKNKDQDFFSVCRDIGPPARMMRWCCTMFKTGPITRALNSAFRDERVLTFYGIRKNESAARSKYNRLEDTSKAVKIHKQAVASPIFFWTDLEIWLYLLGENIDFNDAYKLGFDRVGCWCCPNNSERSQFLAKIYLSRQWQDWHNFLISFAKSIGKTDAEEYVDGGWWKARQGGNGIKASNDVIVKQTNCTSEENARIYNLNKPLGDDFYNLLTPFGHVKKELGRKLIGEILVLDTVTNKPILSVQPFKQSGFDFPVKIKTMNVKDHAKYHRMLAYQVKKFNACRRCLKCESV